MRKWAAALGLAFAAACSAQSDVQRKCEEIGRAPQLYDLEKVRAQLGAQPVEQVRRLEAWTWPEYCVATVDLEIIKIVEIEAPGAPPSGCWTLKGELAANEGTLDVSRAITELGGEPLGKSTVESVRLWAYLDEDVDGFLCRVRFDWGSGIANHAQYVRRPERGGGYFE